MKKMKRRRKKQLALLIVMILIASCLSIMLLTPAFDIKNIEVHGISILKEDQIVLASGIVKGTNIFEVSLKEAEENIKAMGYVDSVKIKRVFPATIRITIVEEIGVAYIKAEEGFAIITADGRCIDITDGTQGSGDSATVSTPDYPYIAGMKKVRYKLGEKITSEDEAQLDTLLTCLHEFSKQGYVFDMREIDVSDISDIKFYYRTKDLCVTVGDVEKIGYKMECFGSVLDKLGENPKGHINLKYKDPIYTPPQTEQPKETKQENPQ